MTPNKTKPETKRLKARKQDWEFTRTNAVMLKSKYDSLFKLMKQPDVVVRYNKTGAMTDGTFYIQITIEGFKAE